MDGLPPNSPTPALTLKTPTPGSRAPKLPRLGLSIPPAQGDRATTPGATTDRPSLSLPQSYPRSTAPSLSLQLPPRSSTSSVSTDGLSSGLRNLNISTDLGSSSRGESSHNLDSRISMPSSASSTAQSVTSSNGIGTFGGSTDPSSAISIYSNHASSDKNSTLPDLDKLTQSLGRDLDVDDLDDDKWMAASQAGMIEEVATLGEGSSGAVTKCKLKNGKTVFALKIITTDPDPDVQKQIRRELEFNRKIAAQHICKYYGAFGDSSTGIISIAMECCEGGSLDGIYKEVKKYNNRIGEKVLGKIAEGVLHGLTYLYSKKIIHRDIKPSNILLTRSGVVKLCDFGVSGEFGTRGDADTFIGTSYYMAPERITGQSYTITSDVWSLGVTILEVAQNRFPFPADGQGAVGGNMLDMIQHIVRMPLPKLKDEEGEGEEDGIKWSEEFKYFIECCLERDANRRATPWRMLEHPWIEDMQKKKVNMGKFLATVWDWSDEPKAEGEGS